MTIHEELGFLTEQELSDLTGHSPRTLANWRSKRIGPPFVRLPGKPPLYPRNQALNWLTRRTVHTETRP